MADDPRYESAEAFAERLEREWADEFRKRKETNWNGAWKGDSNGWKREEAEPEVNPTVVDARTWGGQPRPVREFLDGRKWFRMGMVSNFSGPGAIGKTLVALQACVSMASETTWLNHPIRPGPVIFFSAEEKLEEIQIRLDEICEAENLFLQDFPHPIEVVDAAHEQMAALIEAVIGKSGKVMLTLTQLYHWLDRRMAKLKPVALFVDNRAQVIIGNENDRAVAGFSMRMLAALAHKHGCAVIILSHPSQSGSKTGASGSTQWFNTARSNVFMKRPDHAANEDDDLVGDDGSRELVNNKANYGPGDSKAGVKWEFNRWVCTDQPPRPDENIGKADKAERVFVDLLRWHNRHNIKVSANWKAHGMYAPQVFAAHPQSQRVKLSQFRSAMVGLLDSGRIRQEQYGQPSKKQFQLVIGEDTHKTE